MNFAMLDLETLGTNPKCIVLAIGVALFNDEKILQTFRVHIDPADSERYGLVAEAGTTMWWLDQSKEAQNALTAHKTHGLEDSLDAFAQAFDWKNVQVWCNGASFDFPILAAVHRAAGRKLPWPFYNEMDFRTVKNMVGKQTLKEFAAKPTIAHDCVADAVAQAQTLINLWGNNKWPKAA
jgi:DNA polymerase III epsilon subunit-like protein